ncbi:hypothetical protein DUNSADRAFT_13344 [Dunaliella salina]|uniref:Encoded protein n=1 Tax=Dunaliella salina TaxID=3046 RepID=A0ABQ7G9L1_DUNSA|nr:hypothetical protein DUNSADRAFT_13344 [Dunaliella salina]|eukprot:KAF5831288.1 hypothetical protein DUNSADRAFT_13344 [Dunaliella salina]
MENLPMTSGRVTRSRAKQLEGGMTPSGPATAPRTGAKGTPSAAATPQVLFQDVTNTARKQPASSRKTQQEKLSKEPAASEGTDSDFTACSTETVKGSLNGQASGADEEQQAGTPAALPEAEAQAFDHQGTQEQQVQQPMEAPQPAVTPEHAPQQLTHMCQTASKAEQAQVWKF